MSDSINYEHLMHQAMRRLLAQVLRDVAKDGLPGKHHFFITFETKAAGVDIPDWLIERYPDEMTIVLQEWFANLNVTNDAFSITLNFGDTEVSMNVPFDAIRTFVDPSVDFGLKFDASKDIPTTDEPDESPMIDAVDEPDKITAPHEDAEIVSLDSFRK